MIYSYKNAPRADVYDVEWRERINHVLMLDTEAGKVVTAKQPLSVDYEGEIRIETIKFDSIRPIFGGAATPCLFHCFGRHELRQH